MADETAAPDEKAPVDKAAQEKKREIRRLRDEIKFLRKQSQEIAAKRKELEAKYGEMAAQAGLPPRKKRERSKADD